MTTGPWYQGSATAAAGLLADLVLGEPPGPHPVAAYGSMMTWLDGVLWRPNRVAGSLYAVAGAAFGVGVGRALGRSVPGAAAATALAVAGRALGRAAQSVGAALSADDLPAARAALPALVGRDPSALDESEIARAVVESVAENTVDAVVAPALWAAVAGASGALGYRAVNTLDAMVGYRNERYEQFGWASARLDDAANFIPARATALLVMSCRPRRAGAIWTTVRRDAPAHPSPNAGVAEAAFAAALGVRLGGTNRYANRVEQRGSLGTGRAPCAGDIDRAVRLSRDVTLCLAAGLAVLSAAGAARERSRRARGGGTAP